MSTDQDGAIQDHPQRQLQYYYKNLSPAGLSHYKNDVIAFITEGPIGIEFELEPSNPHDSNAIAIFGISSRGTRIFRRKIGYIPATISSEIISSGIYYSIKPCLEFWKIYEDTQYCWINFHIDGPVDQYFNFKTRWHRKLTQRYLADGILKFPDHVTDIFDLGNSFEAIRDYEHAAMCFEKAIIQRPAYQNAYEFLRKKYKREKLRVDEVRVIETALRAFEALNSRNHSRHTTKILKHYQIMLDKIPQKHKDEYHRRVALEGANIEANTESNINMTSKHCFNLNQFCIHCGWKSSYISETGRLCI